MIQEQAFKRFDLTDELLPEIELEHINLKDFFAMGDEEAFRGHTHSYYQIIWFSRGKGVHYVDFNEYPIDDDTLFFISPGQIHYFEPNTHFEGVMIHFNESFLTDEQSSENIFLKYDVFNAFDAVPYYRIDAACVQRLQHLADEIQLELTHTNLFAYHDYLKCLVRMFLIFVQRNAQRGIGVSLCAHNTANRVFVRFRQLLESHYNEYHTVKEYANLLNVSTKTLTNYVGESTRTTPLKIINERVVLEAKRLLTYSNLKVKEVAYRLGYEDPSYFVKFFKRQTGCLPAEFRK